MIPYEKRSATRAYGSFFRVLQLETIRACTRKCPFCAYGQARNVKHAGRKMPMALINQIADNLNELRYKGRISLHSINEPLLDNRILDIVRLFRMACPRAFISFNTNGDLLTDSLYGNLVDAGIDRIGISVYEDVSYQRLNSYFSRRYARLIDMREPTGKLENRGGAIHDLRNAYEFDPGRYRQAPCQRPSRMMVVQSDGKVVLCCSDMYGDIIMGDLNHQRLEEIWNGKPFVSIRDRLQRSRQGLPLCEACSHSGDASPRNYPRKRMLVDALDMAGEIYRELKTKICNRKN